MTQTSLHSQSWHRVSSLKPRLRSHVRIHRHVYRDEIWYVMQDQSNGQFHRFTPEANLLISLMNGRRSVQEIWETACEQLPDDAMPQDEVIRLMASLHRADVLQTDKAPDTRELLERKQRQRIQNIKQYIGNPSALKLPLVDPERFLQATFPMVRWLFSWVGIVLWLGVVAYAVLLGLMHWPALMNNTWDQVFSLGNVLLIALIYPVVKAIHELGHAYAVKARGGEVHEIGLMFLLLFPIPYVDASAASAFPEKRWRMLVGGAGILVEVFLAALAMIAWANLEPGLARSVAYNVLLICGISTVLMNGNPLLRYDGYYVLADAIEIPNLGQRANAYLGYLFKRYVIGLREAEPQKSTGGERVWFVCYAVLSFVYRMLMMFFAIFLVASRFFFIGILLALWSVFSVFVMPLWRVGRQFFSDPQIQSHRGRSYAVTALVIGGVVFLLALMPVPSSTTTEGVIWAPPDTQVRAAVDGFVSDVMVEDGSMVALRQPLLQLVNAELSLRREQLELQIREYQVRHAMAMVRDRVQAQVVAHQLQGLGQEAAIVDAQVRGMLATAPQQGHFVRAREDDLTGTYVSRGDLLGYVLGPTRLVRVVVPQSSLDRIHQSAQDIRVRLAQAPGVEHAAGIIHEVPAATDELPSSALSLQGGGVIGADARSSERGALRSMENLFIMDLELPLEYGQSYIGGRVYVKFVHPPRSLLAQFYDFLRHKVLRQFRV